MAADIVASGKTWQQLPDGLPTGRVSHSAVLIDDSRVLFFGGGSCWNTDWVHMDEVFVFDTHRCTLERWDFEERPPARRGHSCAFWAAGGIVCVFGGSQGGVDVHSELNDLWYLNVHLRAWSCLLSSEAPDSRRGAVSFVLRDTFYVLGGYTAVGLDARLHALDLAGEKWSVARTTGEPPIVALAACAQIGRFVAIFGGHGATGLTNMLYLLDDNFAWVHVHVGDTVAPRFCHGLAALGDVLVVFGGTGDSSGGSSADATLNDLQLIEIIDRGPDEAITTMTHRVTVEGESPSPRNGFTFVPVSATSILLTGGGLYSVQYFNENWVLDFAVHPQVAPPPVRIGMEWLLDSEDFADITLLVEGVCISAHRSILASRSEYFRAMLAGAFAERHSSELHLSFPLEAFRQVLRFMYSGILELPVPDRSGARLGRNGDADTPDVLLDSLLDMLEVSDALALEETCSPLIFQHVLDHFLSFRVLPRLWEHSACTRFKTLLQKYAWDHRLCWLRSSPTERAALLAISGIPVDEAWGELGVAEPEGIEFVVTRPSKSSVASSKGSSKTSHRMDETILDPDFSSETMSIISNPLSDAHPFSEAYY